MTCRRKHTDLRWISSVKTHELYVVRGVYGAGHRTHDQGSGKVPVENLLSIVSSSS